MGSMDVLMTVTEAATALGLTKQQTLDLIERFKVRKFRACPNDIRFLISMKDVNLVLRKKIPEDKQI